MPTRRTSAVLFGENAVLDLQQGRAGLTDRSGRSQQFPVSDPSDDSYHSAWFAGVAGDFEAAIREGGGHIAEVNLEEAGIALALTLAARRSNQERGASIRLAGA
jgi:predicted dehydrogenase